MLNIERIGVFAHDLLTIYRLRFSDSYGATVDGRGELLLPTLMKSC